MGNADVGLGNHLVVAGGTEARHDIRTLLRYRIRTLYVNLVRELLWEVKLV